MKLRQKTKQHEEQQRKLNMNLYDSKFALRSVTSDMQCWAPPTAPLPVHGF